MGIVTIRMKNALREPLEDKVDIHVTSMRTDVTVATLRDLPGSKVVKVQALREGEPFVVKVFPKRHRPVGQIVMIPVGGETANVDVYCPIHPELVAKADFPPYADLPVTLRQVLDRSQIEGIVGSGEAAYTALNDTQRAGLLNLHAKMSNVGFDESRTVWTSVERIYRVRPDRIFVDVDLSLRDLIKGAVSASRFREVSGKLHKPPLGFIPSGSFKSDDQFGNLQLSFFASEAAPLSFQVDADIDDADGIGHAFQVLRNWITDGTTHPYDIHEILVFRQEVELPYALS